MAARTMSIGRETWSMRACRQAAAPRVTGACGRSTRVRHAGAVATPCVPAPVVRNPSSRNCASWTGRRRARQRIGPTGGLRERDHVADRFAAASTRRSDRCRRRSRRAAGRRSAARPAGSQSATRPPARRFRSPRRPGAGPPDRGCGSSRRRAPSRRRRGRSARPQRARIVERADRRGERVMQPSQLPPPRSSRTSGSRRPTARRGHPRERAASARRGAGAVRPAPLPQRRRRRRRPAAGRPRRSERRRHARDLLLGQELRDRRAPAAVLLHERPHEAACPRALDDLGQRVELRARRVARTGVDRADHSSAAEHRREHLERRPLQRLRHVRDLKAEAPVRTIGAVCQQRLVVGHARIRRRRQVQPAELEQLRHQPLVDVDDVVLLHEGHLQVQLRELRWRSARRSSSRKQRAIWK